MEAGDEAMDMPSTAFNLEIMAPQLQVNLINIKDMVMNTPLAALNLEAMAP